MVIPACVFMISIWILLLWFLTSWWQDKVNVPCFMFVLHWMVGIWCNMWVWFVTWYGKAAMCLCDFRSFEWINLLATRFIRIRFNIDEFVKWIPMLGVEIRLHSPSVWWYHPRKIEHFAYFGTLSDRVLNQVIFVWPAKSEVSCRLCSDKVLLPPRPIAAIWFEDNGSSYCVDTFRVNGKSLIGNSRFNTRLRSFLKTNKFSFQMFHLNALDG